MQSQNKLREMEQESKPFEYLWRLRRRRRLLLRREVKDTWILLQAVNKVLN